MKKLLTFKNIVILVILLVVGGTGWRATHKKSKVAITMVVVERKDLVASVTASGKIDTKRKAVLKFPSSGKLGYMNVEVGQKVKKWQALAGMDMGDLRSAETEAKYKYLTADANAKQIEDEVKGHDSDETYVQKNKRVAAQTARDIAYDNWLEARRAVSNANLFAPFDGIVTAVTVETPGASLGVSDGITVVDPGEVYFDTEIDETEIGRIKQGATVELKLDAFGDEVFVGSVEELGYETRVSSSGATVVPVKVKLPEVLLVKARLGFNGDVQIETDRRVQVLVVPIEAVKNGEVVLEGGQKQKIETGLATDTEVEITGGLTGGEKLWLQ